MKMLIGITQDSQETAKNICKENEGVTLSSEVGPFSSVDDASSWMKFMEDRFEKFEELAMPAGGDKGGLWYGVTFVSKPVTIH